MPSRWVRSVISIVIFSIIAACQDVPKTFRATRQRYENQAVTVDGAPMGDYLLEWQIASRTDEGFKSDPLKHLPLSYKGKRATVVAVQLNPRSRTGRGGVNALGESVSADDAQDPYVDIIVRFDDETLAMKTGYPNTLEIDLASERDRTSAEMEKNLPSVIGSTLYAAAFSKLYQPTATLQDMEGATEILSRISVTKVPLLAPLTIEKARYVPEENAVVLKLRFPDGSEALSLTHSIYLRNANPEAMFLTKIAGNLLPAIPAGLTPKEIEAIKGMKLFRGMSEDAVGYAIGFPEKTNDWGRGGKQLVFFSGKLTVYVDNSGKVVDWQDFN
jgi:hypothetical protein